jgi:hypothetical protein
LTQHHAVKYHRPMGWLRWAGAVCAGLLLVVGACSEGAGEGAGDVLCSPGETRACSYPGCSGTQTCNADGTAWGTCECGTGGTGTGTATATGTGSGGEGGADPCADTGTESVPCDGNVDMGGGETPECQDCIAENCCSEYQTCASGCDCEPLYDCLWTPGRTHRVPTCEECFYDVCAHATGFIVWKTCADCISNNCCDEYDACTAASYCYQCLSGDEASCDEGAADEDLLDCESTHCPGACPPDAAALWLPSLGAS